MDQLEDDRELRATVVWRLNHPLMIIGSVENEWDDVDGVPSDGGAVWNDKYVLVAVAAQIAPVRVRIFWGAPPALPTGRVVAFDGTLNLLEGRLRVGDAVDSRFLVCGVGVPPNRVAVWTEDTAQPTEVEVWAWH